MKFFHNIPVLELGDLPVFKFEIKQATFCFQLKGSYP